MFKMPKNQIVTAALGFLMWLSTSCTSTLYVAPKKADCTGGGAQKCYLIRKSSEGNWILHYEEIKGLEYEPGFRYKLKVKKESAKDGPLDRSTYQYQVVEVMEKRDVTDDIVLEDLMDKVWKMEYLKINDTQYGADESSVPTLIFEDERKVNGFAGCNKYFTSFSLDGRKLDFGEIGSTKMHCEETMELEKAFLKFLESELKGLFIDQKLVLTIDGRNQMILGYQ